VRPGEVELWLTFLDDTSDSSTLRSYGDLLSPDERDRCERLRFDADRRRFMVTRALLRTALSSRHPIAPEAWRFDQGTFGKPGLHPSMSLHRQLSFNVSHTDDVVAVVVAAGREVGVDVEAITQMHADVVRGFFSNRELEDIDRLAPEAKARHFFELWTLKESYLKATGSGLSKPLDSVEFTISGDGPLHYGFTESALDESHNWHFLQVDISTRHALAVCAAHTASPPLQLAICRSVPLRWRTSVEARVIRPLLSPQGTKAAPAK